MGMISRWGVCNVKNRSICFSFYLLSDILLLQSHNLRGTERTPSAWGIDERERDTNDGGHNNNRPKHFADACPHSQSTLAPRYETQLDAEHAEDEEYHKQSEAEGTHKLWNWTMG